MTGTLINTLTIIIGSLLGLRFGKLLTARIRETIMAGLGLFTVGLAVSLFLETNNSLYVLGGLLLGGLLGEVLKLESRLNRIGETLERKTVGSSDQNSTFIQGFVTSSLLFCIGPIAILGSIQDGLIGDYQLLVVKAIMDGFASFAFASTLGVGTIFSAGAVFIYQGFFSLSARQLGQFMSGPMIAEMTALGGVLLLGLAVSSLLEIKKIRVGNFLPGLVITPLLVWLIELFF